MKEQEPRDAAVRERERKRRQAEREAHGITEVPPRTFPLVALGWSGAIVTGISFLLVLALDAGSLWGWLYVVTSGAFAAVLLFFAHRHDGARFGVPLQSGISNGVATNAAVVLAALQLCGGFVGLLKEIELDGSNGRSAATTIIKQEICPEGPRFEYPHERS